MGANHARVLGGLHEFELVAVVDPDAPRGEAVAALAGGEYAPTVEALPDDIAAVVLAAPTPLHEAMGVALLDRGIDLLVEKPAASTVEGVQRLSDAAHSTGRILMVGHIERFNPAYLGLARFLDDPIHLEFTRVGPFSPRVGTDVVLDLMIHDIDLAMAVAGSEVVSMSATGRVIMGDSLDLATALLIFANGVTATLTASRVAQTKVRKIDITQRSSFVSADLVRQDVTIHRLHHNEFLSDGVPSYQQSGIVEIPYLEQRGEPLALELRHFATCVATREAPVVGGDEAREALRLALSIRDAALSGLR